MSGSQQHFHPQVFTISVKQQILPKRQFAEVIVLPDDGMATEQQHDQSFRHETDGKEKVGWTSKKCCLMSICCRSDHHINCFLLGANDSQQVDYFWFCRNLKKVIVCCFLCPYTYCCAP